MPKRVSFSLIDVLLQSCKDPSLFRGLTMFNGAEQFIGALDAGGTEQIYRFELSDNQVYFLLYETVTIDVSGLQAITSGQFAFECQRIAAVLRHNGREILTVFPASAAIADPARIGSFLYHTELWGPGSAATAVGEGLAFIPLVKRVGPGGVLEFGFRKPVGTGNTLWSYSLFPQIMAVAMPKFLDVDAES